MLEQPFLNMPIVVNFFFSFCFFLYRCFFFTVFFFLFFLYRSTRMQMEPASELREPNWHRTCGIRVTLMRLQRTGRHRVEPREANRLFCQLHRGTHAAIDISRGARGRYDRQKKLTPLDPREKWSEAPTEKEKKAQQKFGGQLGLR
jgi:hypothetical protein